MRLAADIEAVDAVLAAIAASPAKTPCFASHAEEILARYTQQDRVLVEAGFPATSPFWLETFERWYRAGKRQLVARVGRRGGKSSSFSRLSVVEARYGWHDVPPGDVGYVAIISTDKSEALGRLATITAILDTLGVPYRPCKAPRIGVELVGRRTGFRVFTASIKGVSGFTAIFVLCDEVAKWADADTGANPATEVLASVRPTMRTMPNAKIALSSSPMSKFDAHYDAFERGETRGQITAFAPTWLANPTVSERDTLDDEPDESTWEREYGAVPQEEAEESLLSALLVDRHTRHPPMPFELPPEQGHRYMAFIDPATRGNAWTLVLVTRAPDGRRRIVLAREWIGSRKRPLSPGNVFSEIACILQPYGVRSIESDQWSEDALAEIARGYGLSLMCEEPWSISAKRVAYEALKSALQQGTIELSSEPQLRADILGIRKRYTRTGVTYELAESNGRHSDYAPCVAMACIAMIGVAKPTRDEDDVAVIKRAKREYLLERQRERQHERRFGRLPPTHRRIA